MYLFLVGGESALIIHLSATQQQQHHQHTSTPAHQHHQRAAVAAPINRRYIHLYTTKEGIVF